MYIKYIGKLLMCIHTIPQSLWPLLYGCEKMVKTFIQMDKKPKAGEKRNKLIQLKVCTYMSYNYNDVSILGV